LYKSLKSAGYSAALYPDGVKVGKKRVASKGRTKA